MSESKDCVFCKIVRGEIPSKKIFENEHVVGIVDIQPAAPIHYLFLPKKHIPSLNEVSKNADEMKYLFSAIKEVADREGISQSGYKSLINTGKGGGQIVFHLHVHLMSGKKHG